MRLITWNVNSIRVRIDQVLELLEEHRPDALCLQELKVADEDFPSERIADAGYQAHIAAQPTYNGVAILTREPLESASTGFDDGGEEDPQQRITRGIVNGVRIINLYVPNGESTTSEKYEYKLSWIERLFRMLDDQEEPGVPTAIVGDFNIAPTDLDVYNPARWNGKVLCSEPERAAFQRLLDWGFEDCLRKHHPDDVTYSWWDYRFDMFRKKKGLRIDHILATGPLARHSTACRVDTRLRGAARPSDHAPVVADFDLPS